MRRVGLAVIATAGLVLIAAPAVASVPSSTSAAVPVPVPAATPGTTVCTIGANAAVGISGLVATAAGYVVIDGVNDAWNLLRIVYLDKSCARSGSTQAYSGSGAINPQDLAIDSTGTLWVADTGDTDPANPTRELISLWKVPSRTGAMTHYKFKYPDTAHNTQALLFDGNGAPIFVTRNISGPASIYTFTGKLTASSTMALTKAGQFQPEQTGTANKLGSSGQAQNSVTGGAGAPDGSRVALRTLSDAYEWSVTAGNVVGALTKGTPSITPLPSEDQGYAIAYTTDGKSFLTVSSADVATPILKYAQAKPAPTTAATAKAKTPKKPGVFRRWFNSLTLGQLMAYLIGIAVFGALLVGIGIFGMVRGRRKLPPPPPPSRDPVGGRPGPAGGSPGAAMSGAGTPGGAANFYPEYGTDGRQITPAYDPYGPDQPASGRYGADPYADPYAAPGPGTPPPVAPGAGPYQGGRYGSPQSPAPYGGSPQSLAPYGGGSPGGGRGGQYGANPSAGAVYGGGPRGGGGSPGGGGSAGGAVYGGGGSGGGAVYGAPDNGGRPYQGDQYGGDQYGVAADPYEDDLGYPRADGRRPTPYGREDENGHYPPPPDDYPDYRR